MRLIFILWVLLFSYGSIFSQKASKNDTVKDTVISPSAFNRLVKKDIRYAILGDQSATPGIKVEIAKDPTIGITGPINICKGILTVTAQGSYKNAFLPIIEEGKIVEGSIGLNWHVIPTASTYSIAPQTKPIAILILQTEKQYKRQVIDSLKVLGQILKKYDEVLWDSLDKWRESWYDQLSSDLKKDIKNSWESSLSDNAKTIVLHFLKKYTEYTEASIPSTVILKKQIRLVLLKDLYEMADRVKNCQPLWHDRQIEIAEQTKVYSKKHQYWITFSFAGGGKQFTYYSLSDNIQTKITKFQPIANAWYNYFRSTQNHYQLIRFGLNWTMNFVPDRTVTISGIATSKTPIGKDTLIEKTEKKQTYLGKVHYTARLGADAEYYLIRQKFWAVGVYGQLKYRWTPLITNYHEIQLEVGPTLNVPSADKQRSLLVILPFVQISNLLPKTYKDPAQKTGDVPFKERIFGGIRVGIPISIKK